MRNRLINTFMLATVFLYVSATLPASEIDSGFLNNWNDDILSGVYDDTYIRLGSDSSIRYRNFLSNYKNYRFLISFMEDSQRPGVTILCIVFTDNDNFSILECNAIKNRNQILVTSISIDSSNIKNFDSNNTRGKFTDQRRILESFGVSWFKTDVNHINKSLISETAIKNQSSKRVSQVINGVESIDKSQIDLLSNQDKWIIKVNSTTHPLRSKSWDNEWFLVLQYNSESYEISWFGIKRSDENIVRQSYSDTKSLVESYMLHWRKGEYELMYEMLDVITQKSISKESFVGKLKERKSIYGELVKYERLEKLSDTGVKARWSVTLTFQNYQDKSQIVQFNVSQSDGRYWIFDGGLVPLSF